SREFQVAGQIDLDAMALADRHRRQPVRVPVHDLRRRVRGTAGNDNRAVTVTARETGRPEPLRQSADEPDGTGCAERRPEVMIGLVAEPGVTELVQAHEPVEAIGAAV